jgi:hypothetical protein
MIERRRPPKLPAKLDNDGGFGEPVTRAEWADRINGNWRKGVESILQVGRDLSAAKDRLDPTDYQKMVDKDLDFDRTVASRLMKIANDGKICAHAHKLPPSWMTLYELTKLTDAKFAEGIDLKVIHPGHGAQGRRQVVAGAGKACPCATEDTDGARNL